MIVEILLFGDMQVLDLMTLDWVVSIVLVWYNPTSSKLFPSHKNGNNLLLVSSISFDKGRGLPYPYLPPVGLLSYFKKIF